MPPAPVPVPSRCRRACQRRASARLARRAAPGAPVGARRASSPGSHGAGLPPGAHRRERAGSRRRADPRARSGARWSQRAAAGRSEPWRAGSRMARAAGRGVGASRPRRSPSAGSRSTRPVPPVTAGRAPARTQRLDASLRAFELGPGPIAPLRLVLSRRHVVHHVHQQQESVVVGEAEFDVAPREHGSRELQREGGRRLGRASRAQKRRIARATLGRGSPTYQSSKARTRIISAAQRKRPTSAGRVDSTTRSSGTRRRPASPGHRRRGSRALR